MGFRAFLAFVVAALVSLVPAGASAAPPLDLKGFNLNKQLELLEQQLQLTSVQKEQYDLAVGATKRVLLQAAMAGLQAKARLEQELGKSKPDLGFLFELRQSLVEDGRPLRREARDEWRKLYAMLDADQVITLKRFVEQPIEQLGMLHELLMQLILAPRERI